MTNECEHEWKTSTIWDVVKQRDTGEGWRKQCAKCGVTVPRSQALAEAKAKRAEE